MRLTRDKVVAEARALLNAAGLDALTTRKLGLRLGVKGPALYRHFKDKQEIITAISQSFFSDPLLPDARESWQEWLKATARSTRKEILSCRDGARIVAMAKPVQGDGLLDEILEPMIQAGFDKREAVLAIHIIGRLVIGWTLSEQEHNGYIPPMSMKLDPEDGFEFALSSVVAGLEMRLVAKRIGA